MSETGGTVGFDPDRLSQAEQYKLLAGSVLPRPIALVVTKGRTGVNAAPFSFFNALGTEPPTIVFSSGARETGMKDTVRNIEETGEFVVHIVDVAAAQKMNICAIDYGPGVDETAEAGFRLGPSIRVSPPRLLDCPVQMECRLVHSWKFGKEPYTALVGEVVYFHFRSGIVDDRGRVSVDRLDPLGRLAGPDGYVRMTDRLTVPRLPVPEGKPSAE